VKTSVKILNQEDSINKHNMVLINKKLLKKANKKNVELKALHDGFVPGTILNEKNIIEEELEKAQKYVVDKVQELEHLEEHVEGGREILKKTLYVVQPCTTHYNLFIFKYSQLMLIRPMPLLWNIST